MLILNFYNIKIFTFDSTLTGTFLLSLVYMSNIGLGHHSSPCFSFPQVLRICVSKLQAFIQSQVDKLSIKHWFVNTVTEVVISGDQSNPRGSPGDRTLLLEYNQPPAHGCPSSSNSHQWYAWLGCLLSSPRCSSYHFYAFVYPCCIALTLCTFAALRLLCRCVRL